MDHRRKKKALFEYKKSHKKELLVASSLTMMALSAGMYTETAKADQVADQAQVQQQVTTDAKSQQAANELLTTNAEQQKSDTKDAATAETKTQTATTDAQQMPSATTQTENKEQTPAVNEAKTSESQNTLELNTVAVDQTAETTAQANNDTNTTAQTQQQTQQQTLAASKAVVRNTNTPAHFPIGDPEYAQGDAVDVASYQAWMTQADFDKLKELGVNSVIVKTTQGTSYVNPAAQKQIHDAREAGMNISVYHYATFDDATSGYAEGQHMATTLQDMNLAKDTLIFADMEDEDTYSVDIATNLNSFWNALDQAGYTNHGVYTYASYLYRDAVINTVGKDKTWLAQYPYEPVRDGYYEKKWREAGYGAWQFSSTAYIPGREAMGTLDLSTDFNGLLLGSKKANTVSQVNKDGHWYLVDDETGEYLTGLQTVNGTTHYYGTDGQMQYGQQKIDGHWYLFNDKGEMQHGIQYISDQNKTVYYAANGQMQYGQQKINGHWYNFDTFDGAMKTGFVKIPEQNKTVYYNKNGQMLYGWQWIDNATRYFDTFDGKMTTGQQKINGHWYLFNDKGEMQRGFQYIPYQNKTVYYNQDGWMLYGQQKLNGHWYNFDTFDGAMKTGFVKIPEQNKTVYYDKNGQMLYGWQWIDNATRYFDTFDGKMTTGQRLINGHWYLFNDKGEMQRGFQYIPYQNKTVYYNQDGWMLYGQQKLNGHWYNFDTFDGKMKTGFVKIPEQNKTVYYNGNGQMLYGQQKLNGHWYNFDTFDGKMKTGFVKIPEQNKTVYYNENGQMLYGQQKLNGHWYNFDTFDGKMKTGFVKIPEQNKTVYYNENGQMLYGTQVIAGKKYYFDPITGAMK